jgi:hypothetical protein
VLPCLLGVPWPPLALWRPPCRPCPAARPGHPAQGSRWLLGDRPDLGAEHGWNGGVNEWYDSRMIYIFVIISLAIYYSPFSPFFSIYRSLDLPLLSLFYPLYSRSLPFTSSSFTLLSLSHTHFLSPYTPSPFHPSLPPSLSLSHTHYLFYLRLYLYLPLSVQVPVLPGCPVEPVIPLDPGLPAVPGSPVLPWDPFVPGVPSRPGVPAGPVWPVAPARNLRVGKCVKGTETMGLRVRFPAICKSLYQLDNRVCPSNGDENEFHLLYN